MVLLFQMVLQALAHTKPDMLIRTIKKCIDEGMFPKAKLDFIIGKRQMSQCLQDLRRHNCQKIAKDSREKEKTKK